MTITKENIIKAREALDTSMPNCSDERETLLKALDLMEVAVNLCGNSKDEHTANSGYDIVHIDIPEEVTRNIFDELCQYFNNDIYRIEGILCDRDEFRKWLNNIGRLVDECDELALEVEEFRRCSNPKVADKDALIAVLTELRDSVSDISKFTSVSKNEVHLQLEEALKLAELSDKTNSMTSSHNESDIYRGCISLMESLKDRFYEWLDYIGVDVTELSEEEQFSARFYATEIVEKLFLYRTHHSGGTSCRMKCREIGVASDEEVRFDFSEELKEIDNCTCQEEV